MEPYAVDSIRLHLFKEYESGLVAITAKLSDSLD